MQLVMCWRQENLNIKRIEELVLRTFVILITAANQLNLTTDTIVTHLYIYGSCVVNPKCDIKKLLYISYLSRIMFEFVKFVSPQIFIRFQIFISSDRICTCFL